MSALRDTDITIDLTNLGWLDGILAAPLMVVMRHAERRGNSIRLTNTQEPNPRSARCRLGRGAHCARGLRRRILPLTAALSGRKRGVLWPRAERCHSSIGGRRSL